MNKKKPIIDGGKWNGKKLYLCGYSLADDKKKFNYIYKNCKYWGFFGDGLCFSCHYEGKECPFKNIKI